MYYLDAANDTSKNEKYAPFLGAQVEALAAFGADSDADIGNVW
jgi:hypothetical protein